MKESDASECDASRDVHPPWMGVQRRCHRTATGGHTAATAHMLLGAYQSFAMPVQYPY